MIVEVALDAVVGRGEPVEAVVPVNTSSAMPAGCEYAGRGVDVEPDERQRRRGGREEAGAVGFDDDVQRSRPSSSSVQSTARCAVTTSSRWCANSAAANARA